MDRGHVERNDAARDRLRSLVARLSEEDLARPVSDGWTVAALLAHVAFWDRFVLARWEHALRRGGSPTSLDDDLLDLINAAALAQWLALPGRDAALQAVDAAEAIDRAIERLPPGAVETARARGFHWLLDRSGHRREHLDQIERALAG